MARAPLYLHEELMLIALRDAEGTVPLSATAVPFGLAASILAELALADQIEVTDSQVLGSGEDAPPEDVLLRECLLKIRKAHGGNLSTWLNRLASIADIKHRVARGLCDRGILRSDHKRVLLAFKRRVYPEVDHGPEKALIDKLERAIFTDDTRPVRRTAALVAIANSVRLLTIPFGPRLKTRKRRLGEIASGALYADAGRTAFAPIAVIARAVQSSVMCLA